MNSTLHEKALEAASRFKRAEADLVSILQEVEKARLFLKLGYTSLFQYCVQALGLSENVTANFVIVSRKAREIPALQAAIQRTEVSVSKARKITPVLTIQNSDDWIEKAKTLSTRKLEEEVARLLPESAVPERMKVIGEDRFELRLGISKSAQEKLKRVQDLESQRTSKPATLEQALDAAIEEYLERHDPVRRAGRLTCVAVTKKLHVTGHVNRPKNSGKVPAAVKHAVAIRDQGQCTYRNESGSRCENRRWIDIHHVKPRSEGGGHEIENLITLCEAHHRLTHKRP